MDDFVPGDKRTQPRALPSDPSENPRCSVRIPRFDADQSASAERGSDPPGEMNFTPISMLVPRQRSTLSGRIRSVTLHLWPVTSYKVELNDATGSVFLRFMRRRSLPSFEPGRWLSVQGTPAEVLGQLIILNPLYCFLPNDPTAI